MSHLCKSEGIVFPGKGKERPERPQRKSWPGCVTGKSLFLREDSHYQCHSHPGHLLKTGDFWTLLQKRNTRTVGRYDGEWTEGTLHFYLPSQAILAERKSRRRGGRQWEQFSSSGELGTLCASGGRLGAERIWNDGVLRGEGTVRTVREGDPGRTRVSRVNQGR